MSEWWSVFAVFAALYLADGVRGGRRERLAFHAFTGRLRARAVHATWFVAPPLPSAWSVLTEDLPCSLAPEGLTNWPSASASRPPPLPDAIVSVRWEEVREVAARAGWLWINQRKFAPATPALGAGELRQLATALAPLPVAARADRLREWQRRRLRPLRLRRRLRAALARSRPLALLNTIQLVLLLALGGYLLGGGPEHVPPHMRDRLAALLPWWIGGYSAAHVAAVACFARAHARLHPAAGSERLNLVLTALLVPPQALRLRLHLVSRIGSMQHPLSVAIGAGDEAAVAALARDTLADVRWPRAPAGLPDEARRLAASAAALVKPLVDAALATARPSLAVDRLFDAPRPASPDACAWCPRCGDQFTRAEALCPHGVPLKPLPKN